MIPAADTRLYAVDARGGTPALLFLSGGFGTVQNWSRVIRRLDGKYRTVRFDARARGKSGRSADYAVQAAVDDIGRVIDATGIERPILVGGLTARRSRCDTRLGTPGGSADWC
jgi:pimeloyl-ACP methyl ester carboxylesterase